MWMACQRYAPYIHAEETCHDIDWQCENRDQGQCEQRAVALFAELGGQLFLQ